MGLLSIINSWSLLKFMSIESVVPSNHLFLCHPLTLLPSIFPSIRVFSHESVLHIRWSKYWSFSFNISPYNEHLELISFRMDCLDLLAVQGTLKSLLQHHSSKASIQVCLLWICFLDEENLLLPPLLLMFYFLFHKVLFSNLVALTISCLSLRAWRSNWRSEVLFLVPITSQRKNHCQM